MQPAPWPYPFWIAHRGAGCLAPENTLAAFRLGAHYGYRMFECDVQLSADGVLFLLHDANLERTTNGHGLASEQPWKVLSALDAGSWHSPGYAAEPLASLKEVAKYCLTHDYFLNLEIKPVAGLEVQTGMALAHAVAGLWPPGTTPPLLSSFKTEALVAAQQAQPQLPRALLLENLALGWLDAAMELGCVAVVCQYKSWTANKVTQAQRAGLRAISYTVNTSAAANRLVEIGLDGIITNRVDTFSPNGSAQKK